MCACSNFADVVWRGSDRFQLPRVLVRNWDGDAFASTAGGMDSWLRGSLRILQVSTWTDIAGGAVKDRLEFVPDLSWRVDLDRGWLWASKRSD